MTPKQLLTQVQVIYGTKLWRAAELSVCDSETIIDASTGDLVAIMRTELFYEFLFVLEFYGPVNNEVMSSRSVNSGTVPGQA